MNLPSLRDLYESERARLGHAPDVAQSLAIDKLEALRTQLIAAAAPRGFLQRLRGGSERPLVRGLYMWGGVGRGKTWIMDLFFQSLPIKQKQRSHFHRFMQSVHDELKRHRDRADPLDLVAEHIARRTQVLCFDELFVADIADAMLLGNLFRSLFDRGVSLVTTSNVPPDGLYKEGLQRARFLPAIRLLKENTEVLNLDSGVDYRLRLLEHANTWFELSSANEATLDEYFTTLTGEPGVLNSTLLLNHRKLKTKRQASNAVWFDFNELCDGPRGQADYIELARCYHAVFVSNMPVLTIQHENPARRFISMIDEFYDRSVKVFVTAAAPIDRIYQGSRLTFEFARSQSRLTEMQSKEYLALPHKP
jgi:cell division protein ZapE